MRYSLLRAGDLILDVDEALLPVVSRWIPLNAARVSAPSGRERAVIICRSEGHAKLPDHAALLTLTSVSALALSPEHLGLRGTSAATGTIDLASLRAELAIPDIGPVGTADAYSMLTLSAAFLLGRMAKALVHAGAAVDPEGRAWLLTGDTHAGKTSTVVSLVQAGWSYLADDQVVVSRTESGEVGVEGWPRMAHLDEGWDSGRITGSRGAVDLRERHGDRLVRSASLAGVLMLTIRAGERTRAEAAHPAAVFGALVRQSPWLMADAQVAPRIASLLTSMSAARPLLLTLGADSYTRGDVIVAALRASAPAAF